MVAPILVNFKAFAKDSNNEKVESLSICIFYLVDNLVIKHEKKKRPALKSRPFDRNFKECSYVIY